MRDNQNGYPSSAGGVMPTWLALIVIIIGIFHFGVASYLSSPPGDLEPVATLDIRRVLGPWNEIARIDNPIEENFGQAMLNVQRTSEGHLELSLANRKNMAERWQHQGSYDADDAPARVMIPCILWFQCGYHVIALNQPHYNWMMVAGYHRDALWVFAKGPGLDEKTLRDILSKAESMGFDTEKLVIHNQPITPPPSLEAPKTSSGTIESPIDPSVILPETPANDPPPPIYNPAVPAEIPPIPKNIPAIPRDIPQFGRQAIPYVPPVQTVPMTPPEKHEP